MSSLDTLKFFSTAPHPCSYLDEQEATTLFVEPSASISPEQLVKLAESGFRRSGRVNMIIDNFGIKTFRMSLHVDHQLRAL